jgi:glyoxylase-like metal-dependent hydrolase (beta-lactamase superfamily II)
VCAEFGVPYWVGESDVEAAEGDPEAVSRHQRAVVINRFQKRFWTGGGHRVGRALKEGDTVGDFTVLEVPGHSAGHVAYWRDRDRVLILGEVVQHHEIADDEQGPSGAAGPVHSRPVPQSRLDPTPRRASASPGVRRSRAAPSRPGGFHGFRRIIADVLMPERICGC